MATTIGWLIFRNAAVLGKGRKNAAGSMPRSLESFLASDQGIAFMTGFWRLCGFCWIVGGLLMIIGVSPVPRFP